MQHSREPNVDVDSITVEILTGKLLATVDEMGIIMTRTSMSPIVYEVLDFACGICAPNGDLIAQSNGITLFTGTFAYQVRTLAARYKDDIAPGDTFVTNDPFSGGTHPNDVAVVRPIFVGNQLLAYAITVAHWLDIGGAMPGSLPVDATSIFQEGLRLPGIRIARDDKLNDDLVRLIEENVRMPELAMGDLRAQIATVRIAERNLCDSAEKYGFATVSAAFDKINESSSQISRRVIAGLPDGVYEAQDLIDGDGVTDDAIPVCVRITIKGDTMTADFTGCAPTTAGPINCTRGALESAVKTVFKALVDPSAPSNEGWFAPLKIVAPEDTVFSANKPAPTGWYYEGSVHASELVWRALAPLKPEQFSAGSYTSLTVLYLTGKKENGELFVHIEPQHGGWGATIDRDGSNALIALTDGDTYNHSVELLEAKLPILVRRYGFNTDGGVGAGRHRGGYGLIREYEMHTDEASFFCGISRNKTPPWGMDGGGVGSCNFVEVRTLGNDAPTRVHHHPNWHLERGDSVRVITGGGGAWGRPEDRLISDIQADIADGLITLEEASQSYGLTLTALKMSKE
jgi:N-methylhydantoinase B